MARPQQALNKLCSWKNVSCKTNSPNKVFMLAIRPLCMKQQMDKNAEISYMMD